MGALSAQHDSLLAGHGLGYRLLLLENETEGSNLLTSRVRSALTFSQEVALSIGGIAVFSASTK
jgi:hypothetical protein